MSIGKKIIDPNYTDIDRTNEEFSLRQTNIKLGTVTDSKQDKDKKCKC